MTGSAPNPPPNGEPIVVEVGIASAVAVASSVKLVVTSGPAGLIKDYRDAVARFAVAATGDRTAADVAGEALSAVRAALAAIYSLREGVRSNAPGADKFSNLTADPYVSAMCFVRGRTDHHWASPIDPNFAGTEWIWRREETLPDSGRFYDGKNEYIKLFENRPVLPTLEQVEKLLRT